MDNELAGQLAGWLPSGPNTDHYIDSHFSCESINPHCALYLEVSTLIFLHDIPSHDDASSYQVSLQKVQRFRRYPQDKHSLTFWTLAVTLTLNTGIQFSHKTLWLTMMYHQTKLGCQRISSSEILQKSHILFTLTLTVTLTLKLAHQFLQRHSSSWWCTTIPTFITNSSAVYEILAQNIDIWNLRYDLEMETQQSNFLTWHCGLWQCTNTQNLVVKGSAVWKSK